VGIGDLSRPGGGDFGPRYGYPGHVSHQNGLDVDVYYPRLDRAERAPKRVGQIDLGLAQELVDRFVAAGATKVFLGPRTPLTGPVGVVAPLPRHDNHLHVRLPLVVSKRFVVGHSLRGRPIEAFRLGTPRIARRVLLVGSIHGNEPAGIAVAQRLVTRVRFHGASLWVVPTFNPDGRAGHHRQNGRGVDLNRNFPSEWKPFGGRWRTHFSGPRAVSEPETRTAMRLVRRLRPRITIWFHQPQGLVRAWGASMPAARRYARLVDMRFAAIRWPPGSASNWQNQRLRAVSFVVELPPGRLSATEIERHVRAVVEMTRHRS
jgi:protein MpaA